MTKRFIVNIGWLLLSWHSLSAQDSSLETRLLQRIASAQETRDSFYFKGMFPSFRYYALMPGKAKEDNNIFFTGLVAFTLQGVKPYLDEADQSRCEEIIQKAVQSYPYFRNRANRPTYNFWPKDPPVIFPNSWFLNHFSRVNALPDDIDDSAILLLTLHLPDSSARALKQLMEHYANTRMQTIRNTFRKYKQIPAYSAWFGERMPVDFDLSVLCNALYFVYASHLPPDRYDSACISLLQQIIRNREYLSHPAYISPHYARPPVLLYNIARLLGRFPLPALMIYRKQLIADTRQQLSEAGSFMDKVILSTALLRLGDDPPLLKLPADPGAAETAGTDFIYFIASFSAMLPNPFKRLLLHSRFIKYFFACPAYNDALLLEYLELRKGRRSAVAGNST